MFHLFLFILATGQKLEYQDTFRTAEDCVKQRQVVMKQILKDNPQIKEADFDNKKFVLYCSKDKPDKS